MSSTVRYARVKSSVTEEDCSDDDDNANNCQLQTIDSEEEDDLPTVKITSPNDHITIKHPSSQSAIISTALWTGLLILCYFILSIGLTFYQRWLLKGYQFPFSVVLYHLFVKLVMSTLFRIMYRLFTGKQRVKLPVAIAFKRIAPTSFFGAIDIGFSQWGLEFVDVAL